MKKKSYKHMTEESFNQVKVLVGAKLRIRQVASIAKVSNGTVCIVKKVTTFPEYKKYVTQMNIARKAARLGNPTQLKVEEKPVKVTETPIYDVLIEIRNLINDTNRILALSGKAKGFRLF